MRPCRTWRQGCDETNLRSPSLRSHAPGCRLHSFLHDSRPLTGTQAAQQTRVSSRRWRLRGHSASLVNTHVPNEFETGEAAGRSGGIRTRDPYPPRVVRYRAALRSDGRGYSIAPGGEKEHSQRLLPLPERIRLAQRRSARASRRPVTCSLVMPRRVGA